ncbi:MAG: filamentous hemagglutinin N-terminal domain-containing protein [Erythrobacter sp.]
MVVAHSTLRTRMLLTTAVAAITALPSAAHAQLVNSGDLSSAVDSAGNPGQLTVTDTSATQTDIEVEAAVVVAEFTDFNIGLGDTVNVTIDAGLGLSEATLFNRVIGGNPSNINGTLNATGVNFWLVNQNGIMFGADATVNARSFLASTNDVANQDIFDFYEGTDLFGNGSTTLGFVDPTAGVAEGITAISGATFVTDGSLGFVGQGLNLNASFDAGSGRAFFLAASDVDVTFTPNSPLSYTVNAGTTVASQVIDGSVNAGSVEFAMFNSVGVLGALLQVDATVNATNVATDGNRVVLTASGLGAPQPDVLVNGDVTSDGDLTITSGGNITAANLEANGGGGVILTTPGDITTTSITSNEAGMINGFIDVDSTGGGTLDLGALSSDGDIDIDTSGAVVTTTITSLGDLTIGAVADPFVVFLNGNVSADAIDITSGSGSVNAMDLEATDGDVNVSATAITAGAVSSTEGDVILAGDGGVTTASITSTEAFGAGGNIDVDSAGGGTLGLGTITADGAANFDTTGVLTLGTVNVGGAMEIGGTDDPTTLNLNGDITAGSFTSASSNVFSTTNDITATDGNLSITASSISTGALEANGGGGVILTTPGDITTTSITSNEAGMINGFIDVDSTGGGTLDLGLLSSDGNVDLDTAGSLTTAAIISLGDLTIGGSATPGAVTFTGNVEADAIDIDTSGIVSALDIESTDGELNVLAGDTISAGAVTSAGGDVILSALDNITTASITSTEAGGAGGAIAVKSTGGGDVTLADLVSDGDVMLDTSAVLTYGAATVGGSLIIGSMIAPSEINAGSINSDTDIIINAVNAFDVGDVVSTNGVISITAPTISAEDVSATGGDVTLTAPGFINTTSITSIEDGGMGGNIAVKSTGGGDLDLGDITADGTVMLDTMGSLQTGLIDADGALSVGSMHQPSFVRFTGNVSAASIDIDVNGNLRAEDLTANGGDIDIDTAVVNAQNLSATGSITVDAPGAINIGSAAADSDSIMGGNLTIGMGTEPSSLRISGDASGANVTLASGGVLETQNVSATNGDATLSGTQIRAFDGLVSNDVSATGNVSITGTTLIGVSSAVADSDSDNLGDLTLTTSAGAAEINVPGAASGANVTIIGDEMTLDAVSATAGDVMITSTGDVTTTSITANELGLVGGDISVSGNNSSTLDLGTITADGMATFDTGGTLDLDTVDIGGALNIGGMIDPSSVRFLGDVSAASVDIVSTGAVLARGQGVAPANTSITATTGDIDIDAASVGSGDLGAAGNIEVDATGAIAVGSAVAGGNLDIGITTMPSSLTLSGDASAATVDLESAGILVAQDVTATGGDANLSGTRVTALDVSATNNVSIAAPDRIDLSSAVADSDMAGGGNLALTTNGASARIIVDNASSGENVTIGGNVVQLGAVTATAGNATINANSITATTVETTGGDALLTSAGAVTTTSITANGGLIDVESFFSGTLNLGTLTADNGVMLDSSGRILTDAISADDDANGVGNLTIIGTGPPSVTQISGAASGASIVIDTTGPLSAQALTATAGDVVVDASSIATGPVAAIGNIVLDAAGAVSVAGATAGGDLNIGTATSPLSLTLTADASGLNTTLNSTGRIAAQNVAATGGDATIDGARVQALAVTATNNVTVTADNRIDLMSAIANTGDLTLTNTAPPGLLRVTGAATGVNVSATGGAVVLGSAAASGGNVTLDGSSINTGALSATGGDVDLNATGNILTGNVTSTVSGMNGGMVDVYSSGGGRVQLADIAAESGVSLNTTGRLITGMINADTDGDLAGALQVGGVAAPSRVDFNGDVSASAVDVDTTGALNAANVTATNGDLDLDAGSINATAVSASNAIMLDTSGAISVASAIAAADLTIGTTTAPSRIDVTGASSGTNAILVSTGAIDVGDVTATAGIVDIDGSSSVSSSGVVSATDVVTIDAPGAVGLVTVSADSDNNGTGDALIGTNTRAGSITATDGVEGVAVTLLASGGGVNIGQNAGSLGLVASNGDVTVNATDPGSSSAAISITPGASATGGNVLLEADRAITAGQLLAQTAGGNGGAIVVNSLEGGAVNLGALVADNGVAIDTANDVNVTSVDTDADNDSIGGLVIGGVNAPSDVAFVTDVSATDIAINITGSVSGQDIIATAGDIDIDAGQIAADNIAATGDVELDAGQAISLASIIADSDNNGAGALTIGTTATPSMVTVGGVVEGASVDVMSDGDVTTGNITASAGDTAITSGGEVIVGAVSTSALTISAADDLTIMGAITATGDGVLEADDIDLQGAVNANGQSLTLRANAGQDVGVGSAAGDFEISDAELDLIDADTLIIDADASAITISDVSFTDQAGASEVVFATTGGSNANIEITGDITANGNGRVFRLGGDADGNGLANRIRANIETATIDLDLSTLDLRANDVVFGQTELFNAVNNRSSEFIGVNIVGNAGSILFNPREPVAGARIADPVYLRVGNLSVTYAESALFQNSIPLTEGMLEFAGVEIGTAGGTGSLTLNPTDTTNAFGLFGSLNELDGDAVAFAPEPFLSLNNNVSIFSSRANGCVIRTGADCVTTVVDSTIISIPREAVSLLSADTSLLVPFDPLVGTNNEGLFSGASTAPGDEDCERDENGQCI